METLRKNNKKFLEIKNTVTGVKNTFNVLISRQQSQELETLQVSQ